MSRTAMSRHVIQFLRDEELTILAGTTDSDREELMELHNKSKITAADMLREYTPEEVRMLCERTKVRVKMYKLNVVWDAKKRFDKKNRLDNKSAEFVNRMFEKAHRRRMVAPYTELEREQYKDIAACHTKKDNLVRLNRWHRQRLRALNLPPPNIAISSSFQSESEPEMLEESQEENMPSLCVEPPPAPLESQADDSDLLQPVIQAPAEKPLPDLDTEPNLWGIGDQDELGEGAADGSGDQEELGEAAVDKGDQEELEKTPAGIGDQDELGEGAADGSGDQEELGQAAAAGIGDQEELGEAAAADKADQDEVGETTTDKGDEPPVVVAETQLNGSASDFDWQQAAGGINSESLSLQTITSTQNTELECSYECFGTQLVAASTQDTTKSQPFL